MTDRRESMSQPELEVEAFFNRPSEEVVGNLSEKAYDVVYGVVEIRDGTNSPKTIVVSTPEGDKEYKVALAQAYSEDDPGRIWKGIRLAQIRAMPPGGVVVYRARSGTLPFVKTRGGDNILIRELENVGTGEKLTNPTAVASVFGLSHREEGRLSFSGPNTLRFERI